MGLSHPPVASGTTHQTLSTSTGMVRKTSNPGSQLISPEIEINRRSARPRMPWRFEKCRIRGAVLYHIQNFLREWFTTLRRVKWTSVAQGGRRKVDFDADAVGVSASTHEERRPGFDQGELAGT
jgi:hypothetical protein